MKKKVLSIFMAVVMVVSLLPTAVFAAEGDNLCDHHTEHTADCGYAPAVEGSPCTHEHDDTCGYIEAVEGVPCACVAAQDGTLTHAEGCGYVEAVAGSDCTHVHDEACGYAAAVEEQPCTYECAECAAMTEDPSDTPVEPAESYTLTIEQGEGGTITADKDSWTEPTDITFTLIPDEGYTFVSAEVYGGTDQIGWLKPESFTDGTCTFGVPGSDVTVQNIVFEKNTTEPDEPTVAATRVIYVDESTFFASGYSHFYDANENLLTTTREEQEDGWVKYTMPADAKYYHTFDGHMGGGGGGNYPELPTNADTYDPFSDTWSCSHPGYAEGNCRLCGKPCPGHTGGTATCTTLAVCKNCGASYGELNANNHNWENGVCTYECGTTHDPHTFENGTCTVCGEPCPGHTYDNACDAECNVCSEIREIGDHVYDGAEDAECNECGYVRDIAPAQITGVSITIDGVVYDSSNTSAEDPAVVTPDSNVILTITGTSLHNGSDDHTVDYANGLYLYVNPDYFEISEDGTTATYAPSTGDFAKSSNFEITYCNNYTDTANRTVVPTGIYLTYDDGIVEENRARITGMSITIDGMVYDSSNTSAEDPAVITPNTEFITITVHGTALQNCTTDHVVSYYSGSSEPILANNLWHFEADGTGAYHYYSSASALSKFAYNTTPYELQYSNNGSFNAANPAIGSGVYIVYDDSTGGEEDTTPAEITGVSITVDGETYTSGNVTITPTSTITLTVTGTNLQNGTGDNHVNYADGLSDPVGPDYFEINEDGTVATYALPAADFARSVNFEITYCNNYTDVENRTEISTGIYLTYDDSTGGEEDTTPAEITGVSITVDGVEYTSGDVTITPTSTIIFTVTGTNFANLNDNNYLGYYYSTIVASRFGFTIDTAANTATQDFTGNISEFEHCDDFEVIYSNDGTQSWIGTGIYLTYDDGTGGEEDTTPAEITGVSITVDGKTYTSGNVTITPTSTIIVTVTGTNFANLSDANILDLGPGLTVFMNTFRWKIDSAANTATADFSDLNPEFGDHNRYEIMYSNDSNQNWTGTGIYLTYDDGTGGEEDTTPAQITGVSITVDGKTYTSGNVTITPTSTITLTVTGTNLQNGTDDNRVNYADGFGQPVSRDYFEINEDGTTATCELSTGGFTNSSNFEIKYYNNYTDVENRTEISTGIYLTYDDGTGGEEDTTPAQITRVSITVDGETYTEGDVTITPDTKSIIVTVTGTNFAKLSADNILDLGPGLTVFLNTFRWKIDSAANTATADFSDLNSEFVDHNGYEIMYSNDSNQNWTGTGIYLTYDDGTGGEEDTTSAEITGVSITVDGVTYTEGDVTITPTSTIIVTVTGTNVANLSAANILDLGPGLTVFMGTWRWEIDSAANTATADFSDLNSEFGDHNRTEITYSNDSNQNWSGTGIYLTYDDGTGGEEDTTPAEITGVSITVDGETYTSGNVTITPDSTVTLTVTGTDLQNGTEDNRVEYADGFEQTVSRDYFEISEDGTTATKTLPAADFASCSNYQIVYYNNYTDSANRTEVPTGIYLTYDDEVNTTLAIGDNEIADGYTYTYTAEQDGSLYITVTELYYRGIGEVNEDNLGSWCAIEINGTAITEFANSTEVKTGDTVTVELISLDNDTYNGTVNLSWDASVMAEITGISITIDGEEYVGSDTSAENPAVITSEAASVILTVHGTNLQYATSDYLVVFGPAGNSIGLGGAQWTMSEDGSRASYDMTWLVEEFTESLPTWEIKYSTNGGLEDAVTGLYVKYEHIPEEALWGTDGDNLTNGGTFAEAIAAAGADSDITYIRLGTDVTDDWGYEIESGVFTLDLNGHTLKADQSYALTLKNAGTVVTLTDTVGGGAAIGGSTFAAVLASDGAKVLINGGSYSGLDAVSANSGGLVEINGGSFTGTGGFAVAVGASSDVKIAGGSFSGLYSSVVNSGTATITGGSFGVGEYGHIAYSEGKLDLSGYDQEKLNGLKLCQRTGNDLTVSDENIKLPEGYAFKDSEDNTVTTLSSYVIYTIGAAGTGGEEEPIVITQQPTNSEAKLGERYCVEVIAQGDGLKYQWYFRKVGVESWSKSSVTDNTYDDVMTAARHNREVKCVITDAWGNSVETDIATITGTAEVTLAITGQPADQTVPLGDPFNVTFDAVGDGLKYQWYFRQAGTEVWYTSGQRDNSYDDVMTAARHNREVYCVVTDAWGNTLSTDTASLIALKSVDLAITKEPESVTANYGERFTVTAEAVGDGVTYEWYYLDPGGEAWLSTNVRSATYSATMSEKIDGRAVYCVARDIWGNQVATNHVLLSCERAELAITKQPNDASAKLGEGFNVEVIAQGDGLKYQWYFRKVGVESWSGSGVKDNTYDDVMTAARHNREVYCVITDAWGNSVTSEIATIKGIATVELGITRMPADQTVPLGDMFNVTFDAVGDGLKYQWYFRKAGTEVWYTSGQRDNSYDDVMTAARHNRELYCVVTDAWGNKVETDPVVVIMAIQKHELEILQQPNDASAKLGERFNVEVIAQGDGLTYQWYFRQAGTDRWSVSGVRDNTYDDVMTKARHNREVYCVITDMWGNSVTTDVATITGTPTAELAIITQPTDAYAAIGERYCVTVEAVGDEVTYQWYFKNAKATNWSKSGVTDNTYDDVMTKTRAGRSVYCVITDAWGKTLTTDTVTLVCN